MNSPQVKTSLVQNARFVKASIFGAISAALMCGAALTLAPASAQAQQMLRCGPQFSTVEAVRAGIPGNAPAAIDLTVTETDRYLDQLGFGRPSNSYGKGSLLVVIPNRGALLGMTDGENMCSPFLRITRRDHQQAVDAMMGTPI